MTIKQEQGQTELEKKREEKKEVRRWTRQNVRARKESEKREVWADHLMQTNCPGKNRVVVKC